MNLTDIDRKLADRLQAEFPLTGRPYAEIGSTLGLSEQEVIAHIEHLKTEGLIRQIGPVFEAKTLGYRTTLVAMRVAGNQMEPAAQIIIQHPGISHGYERNHPFNFWFTLAVPPTIDAEIETTRLAELIKAETAFTLPAVKLFKLRVYFALSGDNGQTESNGSHRNKVHRSGSGLTATERLVINELQQDLPLVPHPFAQMSAQLGMEEDKFLSRCQSLLQRGIMRRFGAALNHRQAGFTANSMTCWKVPPENVTTMGNKLSSLKEVSHCYERKTNPFWPYNLFAMIHGHTREACREIAGRVSAEAGLNDYVMLFSTREFKKTRIKYLV